MEGNQMAGNIMNSTSNELRGQDFSEALQYLKQGAIVYREGWNGVKRNIQMYVMLIDKHEAYAPHFIFYNSELKTTNIWIPSMWDMMGEDWVIQPNYPSKLDSSGSTVSYGLDGGKLEEPTEASH